MGGDGVAEQSAATRIRMVSKVENELTALGLPFADLEAAWRADKFAALIARMKRLIDDAKAGGQDYRILMPETENPLNRLPALLTWLKSYGGFLAGEPRRPKKEADRIRTFVIERYIEPAREAGRETVDVPVRQVHDGLDLTNAFPNVCQVLENARLQELAEVPPPTRTGPERGSTTVFHFNLHPGALNYTVLEEIRRSFLRKCPDFLSFIEPGASWMQQEGDYKARAMDRIRAALNEPIEDAPLGKTIYEVLRTAAKTGPLVRWQTEDSIAKEAPNLLVEFYAAIGRLARASGDASKDVAAAYGTLEDLRGRGAKSLSFGERVCIVFTTMAMVRPQSAAPVKIDRFNDVWRRLTGETLFDGARGDIDAMYRRFARVFSEIFRIMRDDWLWQPRDWIDIQGFLWVASYDSDDAAEEQGSTTESGPGPEGPITMIPENLILYGPPGTGKTYATAREAVRLCGEAVPNDRTALMDLYRSLARKGRIAFVTFHQSMTYEDFVEGRQPVTGDRDRGEGPAVGFRLDPVPGIFRVMAKRAESSRGHVAAGKEVTIGKRRVFKMSLGAANDPDDVHVFDGAIDGGYVTIGWGAFDMSHPRFEAREAIAAEAKRSDDNYASATNQSAVVQMPHVFRNEIRQGDLIVVSKGNSLFRALGEITGDYAYVDAPDGYCHRRSVRWVWLDREGVPVNEIYAKQFSQKSLYELSQNELNIPALERYLNSQPREPGSAPEPFVLIIDEINRANISKVFGELITLLEADKRLGQPNELKVRLPYSGDEFGVPSNLHIVGTMNTADRSIALLDTALRRRFTFREMMPDPSALADASGRCGLDLQRLLTRLNERIEYLYDREHQIGHAYFTACQTRDDVDVVMRSKILPLLSEYFFEDWSKIAAVLGDLRPGEGEINGGFLKRTILKSPPGYDDADGPTRHRWQVREASEGFDYMALLA